MATTEHFIEGGGTTFDFSFPILANSDLKVEVYDASEGKWDLKTEDPSGTTNATYRIENTKVIFGAATPAHPGNTILAGGNVHIYRNTNVDNPAAVFAAGSSIRAVDLNNNQTQVLYSTQEAVDQVIRETDLKDSIVTSAKIANKTIVNDDINDSAAIQGTKISPDFGSQNIVTTGTVTTGDMEIKDNSPRILFTEENDDPDYKLFADDGKFKIHDDTAEKNRLVINSDGQVNVPGNLDVDGTTTLDTTTVDGTLTATSVTVGGLDISRTTENGGNHASKLTHNGTDDLRLQIEGNQIVFEQSDGRDFMSMSHANYRPEGYDQLSQTEKDNLNGRVNIFHAGSVKISTQTNGIKVNGKVDLDSITGTGVVTTGTSTSDEQVYSSKRAGEIIDARIIELVDEVGGFVPIANETSFPTENPDINTSGSAKSGTIVSVQAASTALPNGSTATLNGTTLTISNGRGAGNAVIITGVSATIPSGFGFLVETTETDHTYAFHRLVPKAADVTDVAGNSSNINLVAGSITNVNNVGGSIANVNSVAGNATNINSAVSNAGNINSAVSNASNINTVAGISGNVTTVAGISSNVTAVANDATDIGNVSGSIANVNTVAGISSNVTTVANNNSNVTAVAGNATNINTVAGNNANITTVAGISGNVTTVANDQTDIGTVAGSIANVNTTAGSIANVNTTAGSIANVNTVATNITNVNNASTYLNNFLALYLGEAATAPVVDTFGNPVTEGDFYFNTVNKQLQVFNGSVFTSIFAFAFDIEKAATAAFSVLHNARSLVEAGLYNINLGGLAVTGAVFGDEKIATNRISLTKGSGIYNLGGIT